MTKKISLFLVLMLSILTFGSIKADAVVSAEPDEEVTFILHKYLFDYGQLPADIENTGFELPDFVNEEPLQGAEFEVYDVTAEYQTLRAQGKAVEDAQQELAEMGRPATEAKMAGTTGADGTVQFTLPVEENSFVFLFHESNAPMGIHERATDLVVVLPFFDANDNRLSTIHLYPKNESIHIPIEKEVVGEISYEIGEPIHYEITTQMPRNPLEYEIFRITDSADSVLLFNPDSLSVSINDAVVEDIYEMDASTSGFSLNFDIEKLAPYSSQEIVVRFEMTLSPDAQPDINYFNEASVQYDNQINIDRAFVRTGGYRFVKVDLRDESRTLADAQFILRNESGHYLVIENGNYSWTPNAEDAMLFVSGENGTFDVVGLKYGRYYLTEIEAPEGYVLSDADIPFDVMNGTFNPRATMNIVNQPERPRLPITGGEVPTPERPTPERPMLPVTEGVERPVARPRLPITGEMNTIIYSVIGVALIVLALVILNSKKQKRGKTK